MGPPVFAQARHLHVPNLALAKEASPLHMAPKAAGGWRPCGDFSCLNNFTTTDRYPVPQIHDFSVCLVGATIFSKVDLVRGYHQVLVHPQDVPKSAVITLFGLFEFLQLPFGLKRTAQNFQRLMDSVLQGLSFLFGYLDDILVASTSAAGLD